MFYVIDFTVTADTVTPNVPQFAGHTGDNGAATVRFSVPFDGYRYRVEIVDGGGGYDVTDLLDATDGVVSYELPAAWTTAGVAALRLVAVDGEGVRFHSAPAYLQFADREDGESLSASLRPAWQETLDDAQFFLQAIRQKFANGEFTPQKGVDYYTETDKTEMVNMVLAALPNGDEVSY